jgi:tetratricopeptide (TPR) repeat protein
MRARLVLLAAALLAFGASLGSGFHFDDYAIFSDPALQSARGWLEVWAPLQTRPLTYFTFWLNRQLGAGDPLGYHLFNLLFHLAAVLLAWECLRRLLPERTALIAGVLFALHPMQSEAVDYVWARGIVLAALFCFAALWQWLDGRPWIALAWFALALLAKEECAAFPLLLVWLEWRGSLRGKFTAARKSRGALAAMFALALAAGARVIWATAVIPGAPAGLQAGISPAQYLLVQGAVICRYLQLFAAPYGFTVDPDISVHLLVGIAAWVLLLGATFWLLRRERACATWWIAGLILLIPSSSIFPAADVSADRRMYLPMFAFAAAAALLLARVKAPAVLAGVALLLAGLSVQRTMVWMTEASLWREAVARAPRKLRPKLQLARALPAAQGLELLAKARLDAPYDPAVATETGKILLSEGQPDGALQEFGRALALAPMDAHNMNNRGVALLALGQTEAARADFERALRANPSLAEARENLAKLPPRPQ